MSVKLYYFNGLGRAEVTRWILSYGQIDFEDIRLPMGSIPADVKKKCRWGQLPYIEFEGKSLTQSLAISRYFAKKANLVPEDPYQAALTDEYVDAVQDIINPIYKIMFTPAGQQKEEKLKDAIEASNTKYFDVFERILESNGGKGKYLFGDQVTWADLWLAFAVYQFQDMGIAKGRGNVNKLKENVMGIPKIKEWTVGNAIRIEK